MLGIQEAIDQVSTYLKGVWVKKRYIIISTWLICPIGWGIVASMEDEYESTARLFVDTNSLLRPLLQGLAVYNNPNQQVDLVARTLFSRANLEKIARESDLDITVNTQAEMDELLDDLKSDIKLSSTRENNIYTIKYASNSPELAQRIVQITLNEFVESSLGNNRKNSDSAEEFLTRQIEEYEQRLEEAEQRLANFKISRIDRAPGETRDYYSQLQREQSSLQETELRLLELKSQLKTAQARLLGEEPVFGLIETNEDIAPTISTKYDTRIGNLEGKLDELLIRFTENHPDVVKTKALLENLKSQRNKHIESLSNVAKDTGSYSQFGNINQNPVYQEMKLAVANFESQIASLEVRAEEFRKKIAELSEIIDLVPQIEAEEQGLNRDYEITRSKYLELLSRREQAELSRKAEATSDDVQFRVIDPPKLPTKPSGPPRLVFYSVILFLGFGAGLGLAFLVSQLKPVVLSASQLKSNFGIPVLGMVSHIDVDTIRRSNRRRVYVFAASSACIFAIYITLMWADITYGKIPLNVFERLL
ncbi:lipopolysaccharide biosynthesis [Aestuariibacter sp. AA17]|uniref:Lipopolysaccharide biosynthesis n=1 Tax=Fluctibacter corallii TaxID=2984329 RepID=A0ABT3ACQ2_9ALTE|nr:XrtA system polysaccharide chain length determinant [Aestuariibacter sp. AA17]MCV2886051.1 lipopolysaccharide biosynthesis [Aestuariibacter sp. AA17]